MSLRTGLCIVCKERKPTKLATLHTFDEEGQSCPVLKVEVCMDCVNPPKEEPKVKMGVELFE
jgi:hypothetical protein